MKQPDIPAGPWCHHLGRGKNPRFHIQTTAGYQIASTREVSAHEPEARAQEAEARAIAALPDLLAALEETFEFFHKTAPESGRAIIVRQALTKAGYTF